MEQDKIQQNHTPITSMQTIIGDDSNHISQQPITPQPLTPLKPKNNKKKILLIIVITIIIIVIAFIASLFSLISQSTDIVEFNKSNPNKNATLKVFTVDNGQLKYSIKYYNDAKIIDLPNEASASPMRPNGGSKYPTTITVYKKSSNKSLPEDCSSVEKRLTVKSKYGTQPVCMGRAYGGYMIMYDILNGTDVYEVIMMDSEQDPATNAELEEIFSSVELL